MNGFPTRDFGAQTGHYGIDVAVSEGKFIRAVGDGYVVWADWTQDGGYTIAVQHAAGYLTVYKHNKRLLKRLGDRVRAQEPLAVSGNTGAVTTGPHLHFELWRNGLAQSPRSHIAGW
jgi:murein DD-endopeptidase MepM/ murein hydrolase activator NlpD